MSSLKKDITKILYNFYSERKNEWDKLQRGETDNALFKSNSRFILDQATTQIINLIESALPKEKNGALTNDDHAEGFVHGWDAALKDIKSKLIDGDK